MIEDENVNDTETLDTMPAPEAAAQPVSLAADESPLERIIEALLLASDQPLSVEQLQRLLGDELGVGRKEIRESLDTLALRLSNSASELREVASGFRIQVRADYAIWVARLWQEKPQKFTRAMLETLALICYRQPITRGEIEDIRGVAVSPNIIRTLLERGWVREVGFKEVPGRPALFATTSQLLDDFNLKSLDELPSLPQIKDLAQLDAALAQLTGSLPVGDEEDATVEAEDAEALVEAQTPAADASPDSESPDAEPGVDSQADPSDPDQKTDPDTLAD